MSRTGTKETYHKASADMLALKNTFSSSSIVPSITWCLVLDMADPTAYRLEFSGPGVRFVVIYMRPVQTQIGERGLTIRPV